MNTLRNCIRLIKNLKNNLSNYSNRLWKYCSFDEIKTNRYISEKSSFNRHNSGEAMLVPLGALTTVTRTTTLAMSRMLVATTTTTRTTLVRSTSTCGTTLRTRTRTTLGASCWPKPIQNSSDYTDFPKILKATATIIVEFLYRLHQSDTFLKDLINKNNLMNASI